MIRGSTVEAGGTTVVLAETTAKAFCRNLCSTSFKKQRATMHGESNHVQRQKGTGVAAKIAYLRVPECTVPVWAVDDTYNLGIHSRREV